MIVPKIDFGLVEMGVKKDISIIIENETNATLIDLEYQASDITVSGPKEMMPHSKAELRLSWTPSLDLRQPLDTSIKIIGKEVFKK